MWSSDGWTHTAVAPSVSGHLWNGDSWTVYTLEEAERRAAAREVPVAVPLAAAPAGRERQQPPAERQRPPAFGRKTDKELLKAEDHHSDDYTDDSYTWEEDSEEEDEQADEDVGRVADDDDL